MVTTSHENTLGKSEPTAPSTMTDGQWMDKTFSIGFHFPSYSQQLDQSRQLQKTLAACKSVYLYYLYGETSCPHSSSLSIQKHSTECHLYYKHVGKLSDSKLVSNNVGSSLAKANNAIHGTENVQKKICFNAIGAKPPKWYRNYVPYST